MSEKVTSEQVHELTGSKKLLYSAMQRNGFYLPTYKSQLVTIEWLLRVKNRKIWCPMYVDVRLRPCPSQPGKVELLEAMANECINRNLPMPVEKTTVLPDKAWCMVCLSTLNPDHAFFSKGYLANKQLTQTQKEEKLVDLIDNSDNFYTGLPVPP